ncbi:hypothetical protein K492DRAFT_189895 [Lichtheimia hyalospora FSU 10163]|nr:hypothetical protein K492DRAFT_189895 [Lichtheimia hyalospora FSU 10163]
MSSSNYIITYPNDTPDHVLEAKATAIEASGAKIKHRYNAAIKGFAVEVPDASVSAMGEVKADPDVTNMEADGEVSTQGQALLN